MNSLHVKIKKMVWEEVREESQPLSNAVWAKIWDGVTHSSTFLCMIIRREAIEEIND